MLYGSVSGLIRAVSARSEVFGGCKAKRVLTIVAGFSSFFVGCAGWGAVGGGESQWQGEISFETRIDCVH